MMQTPNADESAGYLDINLLVLLRYLAQGWRFILISVVIAIAITACSLRGARPTYEATMVVAPVADDAPSSSGTQSLTSKVLSSLTLGGGGGAGGQHFDEFQYLLTAPSTIRAANVDGKLFTWLYGGQWDPRTRTFIRPEGVEQNLLGAIRRFFRRPEWYPQDDILTSQLLRLQIEVSPMPKSSLTTVTYDNPDPKVASAVLWRLFSTTDRAMRDKERKRLKAQIANANDMLAATQVSDLRQAMAQQLATSQYRLMNVPENIDYAAENVEPPYVSPIPISPKPAKSLAIVTIVALFLSAFVSVGYRILRAQYDARAENIPLLDPARTWAGAIWRKLLSFRRH